MASVVLKTFPRRRSKDEPPKMSEWRIWILGEIWEEKCSLGNVLLKRSAFDTEVPQHRQSPQKATGHHEDHLLSVLVTPDMFITACDDETLRECEMLSAPGPHVLLLTVPHNITDKEMNPMAETLKSWSEDSLKHLIVVAIKNGMWSLSRNKDIEPVLKLLNQDKQRYMTYKQKMSNVYFSELFAKINALDSGNERKHLALKISETPPDTVQPLTRYTIQDAPHLHLVLLGRRTSSAAATILNQTESVTESHSECVKREGHVCGRRVTLVMMPELDNSTISDKDLLRETHKALSLCSHQIHAFLLVLPVAPLSDDEKTKLNIIKDTYNTSDDRFWNHLVIVFVWDGDVQDNVVHKFIQETREINELCEKSKNKFYILGIDQKPDLELISDLLQMIDEIKTCYTSDTFMEAQMENRIQRDARNKDLEKEIMQIKHTVKLEKTRPTCKICLKIVLVGKTGNGKSATGNTILGRDAFKSKSGFGSVTSSCQKEEGEINGVSVSVVDTPGLFDTEMPNDEVKKEIVKCISLLSPGPHVFLLVLTIGRFTEEEKETLNLIKETFGANAGMFSIIVFTGGDKLNDESIESELQKADPRLRKLLRDCGDRYHVMDNTKKNETEQVNHLLDKINNMVEKNGGGCYSNEMFEEAERAIKHEMERILQKKKKKMEEENKKLREENEKEMTEMRRRMEEERKQMERERERREEDLRNKEESLKRKFKMRDEQQVKEKQQRLKAEEKRKTEEKNRQEQWKREQEELEAKRKKQEEEQEKRDQDYREKYEKERKEKEELHKNQLMKEQQMKEERKDWQLREKRMVEKFEQEKKEREEKEKQRIEMEKKEREKIEKDYESKRKEIVKQQEEWEKSIKEECDERLKEQSQRSEEEIKELRKLEEIIERERKEEEENRIKEEIARKHKEEQERKTIQDEYEKKMQDMEKKYEKEARRKAEEFNEFRENHNYFGFFAKALRLQNKCVMQ